MAGPSRHQLEGAAEPEAAQAELRPSEGQAGSAPKYSGQFAIADRLRAILEYSPDPIFELDAEGTVLFASKLGTWDGENLVGKSFYDLMAPRFRTSARSVVEAAMKSGEPATVEVLANGSGEDTSWLSCRIGPLAGEAGAIVTVRDTTGRRQSEAQLVATDRLASVGTLAAGVAHEINNPLAAVIANLELAVADLQSLGVTGEVLEEIRDAREAAERVRLIVRDLRLFSRTEEPRRGPVDVREVLDSTLRMAWHEIRHRARLVKAFDEVPPVEANEARLGQVFLNLVINAAHAIPEGRAEANLIQVSARAEHQRVVVEISDTGVGMSNELLEHIFTPFFSTRPAGIGTGLGLTICRRLVEDIGGVLQVSSREGKGSVFTIHLPTTDRGTQQRPSTAPPSSPTAVRRGRILVVDDDPMVAAAVRRSLIPDHDVTTTTITEEALAMLRKGERFEVILCDVMMPNMTGVDFWQELERFAPEETKKIVFLTGGAFAPHARQFLDSVPNVNLDKPFLPDKLRSIVREHLERLGT